MSLVPTSGGRIIITDLIPGAADFIGHEITTNPELSTTVKLLDLTGIAKRNDLLMAHGYANNNSTTARSLELYKDAAGLDVNSYIGIAGTGTGGHLGIVPIELLMRVGDPAASLYYKWSGTPTGEGLRLWAQKVIAAKSIKWRT